jgi:hypothetical protein
MGGGAVDTTVLTDFSDSIIAASAQVNLRLFDREGDTAEARSIALDIENAARAL